MVEEDNFLSVLFDKCRSAGLDIAGYFRVGEYNKLVEDRWVIDSFGNENNLGIVFASSKALWAPFKEFIKGKINSDQDIPNDALDQYCKNVIEKAIDELLDNQVSYKLYFDWDINNKCHIQTAGHVSGIADYVKDVLWCTNEYFGIWFAFRAVIVFNGIEMSCEEQHHERNQHRILTEDMISKMREFASKNPLWWKNPELARQYRNIVKGGEEIEYCEEQLTYHAIAHNSPAERANYLRKILSEEES